MMLPREFSSFSSYSNSPTMLLSTSSRLDHAAFVGGWEGEVEGAMHELLGIFLGALCEPFIIAFKPNF